VKAEKNQVMANLVINPYRSAAMKIDTLGVDLSKVGIQLKFIRKNGSKNACSGE
jgi:hypothetical protein